MKTAAVKNQYIPTAYRARLPKYRYPNEARRGQKLEQFLDHALMAATCAGGTAILLFFFVAF